MADFKVPGLPVTAAANMDKEDIKPMAATSTPNSEQSEPAKDVPKPPLQNCPYKVPLWSAPPPAENVYKFEVLKSGLILEEISELQSRAYWTFGRVEGNDVVMAHPTISRFHAVLQYRPKQQDEDDNDGTDSNTETPEPAEGWYIYDLNSTHGTFLNKQRVPAHVFIRIRVGHMLRFGASTRSYILQGPSEDEEPESELSVTELRAQREEQRIAAVAEAQRKAAEAEARKEKEGISWGMAEDADEQTDLTHNPYASTNNEELFLDDPKRTLRGYFEREGLDLVYKCDEMSTGSFICRVELPLDDANGRPLVAEVVHKGRKKECVVQCALEACRMLDRHGVLRQANQEPMRRKAQARDSDSDDDEFWDRTGDVERKKMRKSNPGPRAALTYEDLLKQDADLLVQLQQVDADIAKYHETEKRRKTTQAQQEQNSDDLDNFMESLSDDVTKLDKTEIRKLRLEQQRIKTEQQKLKRLIQIAKPLDLPFVKATETNSEESDQPKAVKRQLPMIGKRNQFSKFKVIKLADSTKPTSTELKNSKAIASDEEEVEEDDVPENEAEITKEPRSTQTATRLTPESVACKQNDMREATQEISAENTEGELPTHNIARQYGPAHVPSQTQEYKHKQLPEAASIAAAPSIASNSDEQVENIGKKRRQRQRQRLRRQEEELDQHETSEKYAKWVPPANQSGDGYTELNKKYGY